MNFPPLLSLLCKTNRCDKAVYLEGYRNVLLLLQRFPDETKRASLKQGWKDFLISKRAHLSSDDASTLQPFLDECESRIRFLNTILPFSDRLRADQQPSFRSNFVQSSDGQLVEGNTYLKTAQHRNLHVLDPIDLQRHQRLNQRFRFGQ